MKKSGASIAVSSLFCISHGFGWLHFYHKKMVGFFFFFFFFFKLNYNNYITTCDAIKIKLKLDKLYSPMDDQGGMKIEKKNFN